MTVTFGPNELSRTVQVPILTDAVYEATERFYGRLSSPSGGEIVVGGEQAEVFIADVNGKLDVELHLLFSTSISMMV